MQGICQELNFHTVAFTQAKETVWESKIRDLIDDCCSNHCNHQCCCAALVKGANYLQNELITNQGFLNALDNTSSLTYRYQQSWTWRPLIDTPFLQAGLFNLYRSCSIPLHDHPNTWGVQKVVSGKVRIRQYKVIDDPGLLHVPVLLKEISDHTLIKGDHSTFTPSLRNHHQLESIYPWSMLFTMKVNTDLPQDGSLYFQVTMDQQGKTRLYNKIRRRSVNGKGRNLKSG